MKKLFTIDNIVVCFIAALGYGFGESISSLSGWPTPLCIAASFALGLGLEWIVDRIVFSEAVQRKPAYRILAMVACFLVFIAAHALSMRWMGVSMLSYLADELLWTVGLPVIGFGISLLVRAWRISKVRERYGDGRGGYVFDLKKEDIEEVNRENQSASGPYDSSCAVRTKTGVYVGEKQKKVVFYLGIPYAKPPVGERRWKAPEAPEASEAVFEARNFGASAIQTEQKGSILKHHRQSEDCLTLNICASADRTQEKKPVLVLFHPGDFSYGGSADPLMYGGTLVEKHPEVVVVSLNFRLGIFGFIDFSKTPGGENYPDAVNLGLLDQIAALRWIRENIAAFGGDPERITAAGFEAGAVSVSLLAACGKAKGLFRKAFLFFGSPAGAQDTPEASRELAKRLLRETGARTAGELAQLPAETLKEANRKLWRYLSGPVCDGRLIPADVNKAYQEGAAAGIDFVIGIPANERKVFQAYVGRQKYKDTIRAGVAALGEAEEARTAEFAQAYLRSQTGAAPDVEAQAKMLEELLALCMYFSAEKLREGGNQVRLMYWNEKPVIENLGSGTVDAVSTLLGNSDAAQMYGNVLKKDLSEVLQQLFVKFMSGEVPELYSNEIRGVDPLVWEAFPKALIVADGKCVCDTAAAPVLPA